MHLKILVRANHHGGWNLLAIAVVKRYGQQEWPVFVWASLDARSMGRMTTMRMLLCSLCPRNAGIMHYVCILGHVTSWDHTDSSHVLQERASVELGRFGTQNLLHGR